MRQLIDIARTCLKAAQSTSSLVQKPPMGGPLGSLSVLSRVPVGSPRRLPRFPRAVPGWAHTTGDLRAEDPAQDATEPRPGGVASAAQPLAHSWASAPRWRCPFIAAKPLSARPRSARLPAASRTPQEWLRTSRTAQVPRLCIPLEGTLGMETQTPVAQGYFLTP